MLTATQCDGVATLTTSGPLDLPAVRAVGAALARLSVHAEVVVLRGNFDGSPDPTHLATPTDREQFALQVQATLGTLAAFPAPTVGFVEGRCLGLGVDLLAACDTRLAVTGPDAWVAHPTGLGVSRSAFPPVRLTAREACRAGFVGDAFTARRAAVELALHTDRIRRAPRKRVRLASAATLAGRRLVFLSADLTPPALPGDAVRGWREVAVAAGDFGCFDAAVEVCLRGGSAVALATSAVELARHESTTRLLFEEAERRGRVTPLERGQAEARMTHTLDGGLLKAARRVLTARPEATRFLQLSPWAEVLPTRSEREATRAAA